jgi:hypothetical protein
VNMSANHFLSSPTGREPIDPATLAYMRQRNRGRVYSVVIDEFEKIGISQTDLAGRLHKGTDQISRWLGSPGNWTLDTVSDLFFAISGGEPAYGVQYPLDLSATNDTSPNWTNSVTYYKVFPHTNRTVSISGTANINQQVTGMMSIVIDFSDTAMYPSGQFFHGGSSLPLAVQVDAVDLTTSTSCGSPSFGVSSDNGFWTGACGDCGRAFGPMGFTVSDSGTYLGYGGNLNGLTSTLGGKGAFSASSCSFTPSGDEYSLSLPPTLRTGMAAMTIR